jgi:hypothetical protein
MRKEFAALLYLSWERSEIHAGRVALVEDRKEFRAEIRTPVFRPVAKMLQQAATLRSLYRQDRSIRHNQIQSLAFDGISSMAYALVAT